ncbi:hypothetical protein L798_13538 [Zootermopsis nevadensis]|uniref:Uncharacterized protein n=1 Tax=Zootermopsis nevadensis TaxID=136037 RepID=A0A067QU89_ZOONE|nr:hypothetical protein L798_13538 [Zootermopsis nevadensis]
MVKKKGKKSSGQREEQAAEGQPQMKTIRQRVGSSQHEHQKQHEAPPVLSSGCIAGPSQQSQGQRDQGPQNCSQPQNQQPLNPPTYDAGRGRGQGNPRAGTVRQQTGDADVAAITKGIQTLKIPNRTGCGTKGRKTAVETNYLSLDLSKLRNKIAIHYDVEFKPSPFPKRLLRCV